MIDARPSDAIALALRWDCPIFISKSVLDRTKSTSTTADANVNADELRKWLENLNEDDTMQYQNAKTKIVGIENLNEGFRTSNNLRAFCLFAIPLSDVICAIFL